jgi:two-component system response regulator AlgR
MLKILIVDDEKPARKRLRRMLSAMPSIEIAGEAETGQQALTSISSSGANVLLLDISMPGMDGMALARRLQGSEILPAIIFCTAWSDQALQAFECEAVDYLVKPVRAERLEAALEKARRYVASQQADTNGPFIRTTLGGNVSMLPLAKVFFIRAEDKYTTVLHQDGESVIDQSLTDLEADYGNMLVRIHRNTLVVKSCIRGLEKTTDGRHLLKMAGCEESPQVSRRNLPSIRKLIRDLT